jgi:eukaryotic-like serine/threonine-protein kinase
MLIYQEDTREERRLTWFDRAGKKLRASGGGSYGSVRLSPDGERLSFDAGEFNHDIWVDELARGVRMRLTNDPETYKGTQVWSPDGSRILFGAFPGKAVPGIYQMNSNGSGGMELLLPAETPDQIWPTSWSPDGKYILCARGNTENPVQSIWLLPLADRKPRPFVQNGFDGQFSPDGRWVAYTSVESGAHHIYIVPFDATKVLKTAPPAATSLSDKWQISAGGGAIARWRGDGREIFYYGPGFQIMAAQVDGRGTIFKAQKEQALFRAPVAPMVQYDVTPDGKQFVMTTQRVNPNTPLTLVVNWTARLGNKP